MKKQQEEYKVNLIGEQDLRKLTKEELELLVAAFVKAMSIEKCNHDKDKLTVANYDLDSLVKGLLPDDPNIKFVVWNKIWKRSLIDNIRFKEGQVSEDIAFDRQIFLRSKGLVHINKTLYNYRQNREGNTSSSFKLARMCVIDEFKEFINDLDKLGKPELGDIVTIVAAEHLIDYYNSAIIFHQSKTIRKKIFHGFLIFYKRISVNKIATYHE